MERPQSRAEHANVFDRIKNERGGLANIHTAFTDFPASVSAHYDFYNSMILAEETLPLSRAQREALAYFTSEANECPYCIGHHKEAFENYKDQSLSSGEISLFRQFATVLTKEPWKSHPLEKEFIDMGFSKEQWLHAIVVVSYFNMANRIAFATNIPLEDNFADTCK